jgi:hypothetical protein
MRGSIFDLNIYNHILQFVDGRGLARWMRTCKTICAHIRANPTMVALIYIRAIWCDNKIESVRAIHGNRVKSPYVKIPIPLDAIKRYAPNAILSGVCSKQDNLYYIYTADVVLDTQTIKTARVLEKLDPTRFRFMCTAIDRQWYISCLRFTDDLDYIEYVENWKKRKLK